MIHRQRPVSTAVAVAALLSLASTAFAQLQSKDQEKCINKLNKAGTKVAQAQAKENQACLKGAGKNTLVGTAQACLTADAKQKVATKRGKTTTADTKFCTEVPDFGYSGATATNDAAQQAELDLIGDVFGTPLDAAVIDCTTDKTGCVCQQKVLKSVEKIASTKLKEFLKCKKQALKDGATSAAALQQCVADDGKPGSIAADTKGKIAKQFSKLEDAVVDKCNGVSGAFPGVCGVQVGTALATCIDVQVECRACQTINEMDNLLVNCDAFDDGNLNASCDSGANQPTPTATSTPAPGVEFQGALLKTSGRFTYQATVGIAGANAECNTQFPGTHACTYAELQIAEAAGDLDGAQDTGGNPVTVFWAIDSTRPDVDQCTTTLPWDYQTADTGHFADIVTLNNGTGMLGALVNDALCLQQRWVGCCL